ncbi:EF-hand domain-containing protein [Comamonas jiangduensis]|uniref:EF-hand domain-containing protein n=1 Tax=Comamonas jiangduensis TaxID=1194168 RepID=A0ABV4IA76_9BURK
MPSNHRHLHAFDLRSVVLFTSLTLGGTTAVFAQAAAPSTPDASAQPTLTAKALTPSEVFMRSDVNRDGQLSRAEAKNLPSVSEQFAQWDRDGNGQISLEEFLLNAQRHE